MASTTQQNTKPTGADELDPIGFDEVDQPGRLSAMYQRRSTAIHTAATIVLGIIIWQAIAANMSSLVIRPLPEIWDALVIGVTSGQLFADASDSLQGFVIGFAIAALFGVAIGVLMAVSKVIYDFLDPWMSALYSTPLIALAPLYIVVFGIGMTTRIAVVVTLAIFPIVLNTTTGIRATDPNLLETGKAFGANRQQTFFKIMLPSAVPFVIAGLRLGVGRGLMGIVVAEFFGSTSGLGYRVFTSSQTFDIAAVWLGVFVLAAIGVASIRAMYVLERYVAPWRHPKKRVG